MAATFESLGLCPALVDALVKEKFVRPTPVQAAAIPQLLSNRDVVAEACTGSGKTLAYLLPTLELLVRTKEERSSNVLNVGALILCPTRELAIQIDRVTKPFCAAAGIFCKLMTSGDKHWKNKKDEENNSSDRWDLIVGTPGRIDEWSQTEKSRLRSLEVLILDEADTLLGPGFHMPVQSILSRLPKQRRTGLFSATQAKEVQAMVRAGLRNPATISVKVLKPATNPDASAGSTEPSFQKTPMRLSNYYKVCESDDKLEFLVEFIRSRPNLKFIVFFATCASVDYFGDAILKNLLESRMFSMHGKMNAKRRALTFEAFVKSENGVLACTDVIARGIDLPDVDWIIQIDAPKEPDFFVHRVGRTARAGRLGSALLLLLPNETAYVEYLSSQRVPLDKLPETDGTLERGAESSKLERINVSDAARKMNFADRDVLERGTRAFVAYVAYYSEHRLSYLFQVAELNFLKLVSAFHLLRLPKMKEFRNEKIRASLKGFEEVPESSIAAIKFKSAAREDKRRRLLEQGPAFNEGKRQKKGKQQQKKRKAEEEPIPNKKKKGKQERIFEEWDELAREEQLYRQLKRGKLKAASYDKALMGDVIPSDSE